jgi:dolichol-phosphate mannosyltransferase
MQKVSIIVPTYKEVDNIQDLVDAIDLILPSSLIVKELLIVDDDSQDGTEELVENIQKSWVRLIIRRENKGLSQSVLEGISQAYYDTIVVMDADLSHPVEAIPHMLAALNDGNKVVVGSRYVEGASTDEEWGVFRWINSKVAILLARLLTSLKDPMSGFFAFDKGILRRAKYLNPIGYKILLEILVKCHVDKAAEIPIHFSNRKAGYSKLNLKQQIFYLMHLRRLMIYRYAEGSHLAQFIAVGVSGLVVNIIVLTFFLNLGMNAYIAVAAGIGVSIVNNFLLNRRFSFSYAKCRPILEQFVRFVTGCMVGATVNYSMTLFLVGKYVLFSTIPQYAALLGVSAGTIFNYLVNRYVVFAKN